MSHADEIREEIIDRLKLVDSQITRLRIYMQLRDDVTEAISTIARPADWTFVRYHDLVTAETAIITIRRLTDRKSSRSLDGVLNRMRAHPNVMTKDLYVTLFGRTFFEDVKDYFEPKGKCYLRISSMESLREDLAKGVAPVRDFGDKVIAHLDPSADNLTLPFADIENALDKLHEIRNVASLLLTCSTVHDHVYVPPTWKQAFAEPLFPRPN